MQNDWCSYLTKHVNRFTLKIANKLSCIQFRFWIKVFTLDSHTLFTCDEFINNGITGANIIACTCIELWNCETIPFATAVNSVLVCYLGSINFNCLLQKFPVIKWTDVTFFCILFKVLNDEVFKFWRLHFFLIIVFELKQEQGSPSASLSIFSPALLLFVQALVLALQGEREISTCPMMTAFISLR